MELSRSNVVLKDSVSPVRFIRAEELKLTFRVFSDEVAEKELISTTLPFKLKPPEVKVTLPAKEPAKRPAGCNLTSGEFITTFRLRAFARVIFCNAPPEKLNVFPVVEVAVEKLMSLVQNMLLDKAKIKGSVRVDEFMLGK